MKVRNVTRSWFYRILFAAVGIFLSLISFGQLTGTKNVPGDYPTLASAIADLNAQGVGSGGVTINLISGNPETAPAGGYIIGNTGSALLTSTSVSNQVIIEGNGNTVTAGLQTAGAVNDGIFVLVGADWVTIRGFNMIENPSNTTTALASNNMTEWGVALLYVTDTDGAKNNTIQNNTITLSSTYQNAVGIYSSTAHSLAAPTTGAFAQDNNGLNNGLKVYTNTISGVAIGIYDHAPASNSNIQHFGDDIGGTSLSTGNNISYGNNTVFDAGWGGFSTTSSGIHLRNIFSVNIQYNTVTSGSMTVATVGILVSTSVTPIAAAAYSNTISNNNVTATQTGSSGLTGIQQTYGNASGTHSFTFNTVVLNQNLTAASSSQVNGIISQNIFLSVTASNNNITINQTTSSGANSGQVNGLQLLPGATVVGSSQTASNNIITIKQATTGGTYSGTILYIWSNFATNAFSVGTGNFNNNQLLTTGSTLRTSGGVYGIYHDFTYTNGITINGNTITWDRTGSTGTGVTVGTFASTSGASGSVSVTNNNFTLTGTNIQTGQIQVFNEQDGLGAATTKTVTGNTISVTATTYTGTLFAFLSNWSSGSFSNNQVSVSTGGLMQMTSFGASGGGYVISNNTFTLSSAGLSPTINGIIAGASASGSYTISNNTFNTVTASAASTSAPSIIMISVSGGALNNIFGNVITGSTTGAGSGTATITGIGVSGGTTNNVYQNKIYGLSSSNTGAATIISGIRASGGTSTHNIYNNLVGISGSLGANASLDAVRGINVSSTVALSQINVHHNTVYINATSSGANFGTTGIFHAASATATTARLDIRNNIVLNLSTPNGTGITSCLRRSVVSTYGNYAVASDRNFYFAGTPGATRAILNDNGTAVQTLANFQTAISSSINGREANSFTDEGFAYATAGSFFSSLTGSNAGFLHLVPGISSRVEGGGLPVYAPLITDDYDGNTRSSSRPDIGADEFAGTNVYPSITNLSVPVATCTATSHVINADVTIGSGSISTVTLNYNNGSAGSVAMSLVSGDTYTATIPAGTPGAVVTWSVRATGSNGNITSVNGTSYKDEPLAGLSVTASASVNPVCSLSPTNLSVAVAPFNSVVIGSGTTDNYTNSIVGAFYATSVGNARSQLLFTAAELNAAGIYAGNITALRVTTTGGTPAAMNGLTIRMASTAATSISGAFATPSFTTVYGPQSYTPVVGLNTHAFSTPFVWDGTSNIIVDYCFSNLATGTSSMTNNTTATSFGSAVYYGANGTTAACGISTVTASSTIRPNISFTSAPAVTAVSWSDGVNPVGSTNPLTVNPASGTTYTASITAAGCSATSNALLVNVNSLPAAPSTAPSTQCGTAVPQCFAAGSTNGNYRWYLTPTGGTSLPGETNNALQSYSISTTTTFYVSIFDGNCESLRTSVTATVNLPDPVQASSTSLSVCLGGSFDLSAANTATPPVTNTYNFTWAANTITGSGISAPPLPGTPVTITPTAAGTYTYTVTANDPTLNCTTTSSVTVQVKALPVISSATASPATSCAGSNVVLNANIIGGFIGTSAVGSSTTTTQAGSPFRAGGGAPVKTQLLYTASELTSAGFTAGRFSALAFNFTTASGGTLPNFTIRMGTTAATVLTSTFEPAPSTVVFAPSSVNPPTTTGVFTLPFSTPFQWNGTSNILIEFCHDLPSPAAGSGQLAATTTALASASQLVSLGGCAATTGATALTTRPQIILTQSGNDLSSNYNWVWNPGAISGNTATVNPVLTTTYTVTVTDPATTCSKSQDVTVTVNPLPPAPGANSDIQCGTGLSIASVTSGSSQPTPVFNWYLVPTGGIAVQTGTSNTYLTPISTTTTFYVAEVLPTGCEGPRSALTATVNEPDPVFAFSSTLNTCVGNQIALSGSHTPDINNFLFSWTASPASGSGLTGTVNGLNINVTPTAAGAYVYTLTGFDPDKNCSSSASVTVNVNVLPNTVTANFSGTACTGTTINLTSSANTGAPAPLSFSEAFDATTLPGSWTYINAGTGSSWISSSVLASPNPHTGLYAMAYLRNTSSAANAWAISPAQSLVAGRSYTITWWYRTASLGGQFPEKLKVTAGNSNTVAAQTTILWNNNGGSNLTNETYLQASATFTPSTTGNYYFGWNCYSNADENVLFVDDVAITETTPVSNTYAWTSDPAGFTSAMQNPTGVTLAQTTTYTVTATNSFGCSAQASVTVNAIPLPNAPVATNSQHCGLQVPSASVSTGGSNGTFNWYDAPTGGNLLQAGGSTYLTAVGTTTTFYVSENNGTCESLRTPVTVTVTNPPTLSITPSGATTFCLGGSVTLSKAPGSDPSYVNFNWRAEPTSGSGLSGTSGPSITVAPTVAGTYTIDLTADDGIPVTGCTNVTSIVITVNPNPVIDSVHAVPASICVGGTASLSAFSTLITNGPTSLPGTYCVPTQTGASLVNTVSFNAISNSVTQVTPFYNIYSNTTSVTTGVSYTLSVGTATSAIVSAWIDYNRNGVFEASEWTQVYTAGTTGSVQITIPNSASPGLTGMRIRSRNAGNGNGSTDACTAFGSGSTHDYAITIIGRNLQNPNFNYSWNPGSLTGSTVSVSPASTTTYTVTLTDPITNCSASTTLTLPVLPLSANASASPATSCAGAPVTLNANATGGAPFTYSWSDGTNIIGSTASLVVNPTSTTTYTVTVTDACSNTFPSSVTVTVNPLPSASIQETGPVTICAPNTQVLTAQTDAASPTYQWTLNGSDIPSATGPTYTVSGASGGLYRVVVTNSLTGCSNTSAAVSVTINPQPAAVSITPPVASICAGGSQAFTASSAFGPGTVNVNSGTISVTVPDVNAAGISNNLNVSGVPFGATIDSVIVQFSITHSFDQDVQVNLEGPNGQVINLVGGVFVTGTNFTNTRISSDNSKPAINSVTAPFTGTFRADALLSGFQLAPSVLPTTANFSDLFTQVNGTWKIRVVDDEALDIGTLTNWRIKVSYSIPAPSWSWTPATGLNNTNTASVTANPTTTTTYTATATNDYGCSSSANVVLTVNPRPTASISGGGTYCQGQNTATNLTLNFTGTAPWDYIITDGVSFISGTTSSNPHTVTVTPNNAVPDVFTYSIATLNDANCVSVSGDLTGSAIVTINPVAANPTATVTQPSCALGSGSITMTAPLGTGNSYTLDGTTTISWPNVTFSGVAPGNHTITVANSFGCSAPASASVTVDPQPFSPGAPVVSGPVNVCQFVGTATPVTYTATATGNGTQTFNWILPPNVTLQSGAGTNTITVTFAAGFTTQANKQIRVTATNQCGTSAQTIYYLLAQLPNTPAAIVASSADVCAVLGTSNFITYTIPKASGASSYIWTAQGGTTTITHPNGLGVNDTTVQVTFTNGFTTSAITVQAVNSCGTSGTRSLTITRAIPGTPSLISGPTNICANIAPLGTAATYTVPQNPTVSSYNWTLPAGALNITGQGTNTVSFIYPAGFTSGTISVTASNGCGTSAVPRTLAVTVLYPATPSPIDVVNTVGCEAPGPDRVYTYSLASLPANAASVQWTVPAAGTLVSGQGSASITVSYPPTALTGVVTATAVNNCGSSVVRSVDVKLAACPPDFASNNAPTKGITVAPLPKVDEMAVTVFPNPTVSDFKLQVQTSSKELIHVRVLDMTGREYRVLQMMPGETLSLGAQLKAGSYILEVRQGKSLKTTKVLKF